MEARTYVGVALSLTGGELGVPSPWSTREFYPANILTVDAGPVYPAVYADAVDEGTWFYPCANERTPGEYYFGDYNGGVFPNDYGAPDHLLHVSAWADSRAGCDNLGDPITDFMHVYTGRGEGPF